MHLSFILSNSHFVIDSSVPINIDCLLNLQVKMLVKVENEVNNGFVV